MRSRNAEALDQLPNEFAEIDVAGFHPEGSFHYLLTGQGALPPEGRGVVYNRRGTLFGLRIQATERDPDDTWTARCSLCFAVNLPLMLGADDDRLRGT